MAVFDEVYNNLENIELHLKRNSILINQMVIQTAFLSEFVAAMRVQITALGAEMVDNRKGRKDDAEKTVV